MIRYFLKYSVLLISVIFSFSIQQSYAATITSIPTGGYWDNPSTWEGGIVPGINDDVIIHGTVIVTNNKVRNLTLLGNLTNHAPWEHYNSNLEITGDVVNNGDIYTSSNGYGDTLTLRHRGGTFVNNGNVANNSLIVHGNNSKEFTLSGNPLNTTLIVSEHLTFLNDVEINGYLSISPESSLNVLIGKTLTLNNGSVNSSIDFPIVGEGKLILAKNSQTISGIFPIKNVEFTGSGTTKVITQTKFENILIGTGVNFTNHAPWEHYNGNLEVTGNLVNNGNIYTSSNGYEDGLLVYSSGNIENNGSWNVSANYLKQTGVKSIVTNKPITGAVQLLSSFEMKGNPVFKSNIDFNNKSITLNNAEIQAFSYTNTGVIQGTGGILKSENAMNANIYGTLEKYDFLPNKGGFTLNGNLQAKEITIGSGSLVVVQQAKLDGNLTLLGNLTNHAPWEHYNSNLEITGDVVNNGNIYTSSNGYGDTLTLRHRGGSFVNNGNVANNNLIVHGNNKEFTLSGNPLNTTLIVSEHLTFLNDVEINGYLSISPESSVNVLSGNTLTLNNGSVNSSIDFPIVGEGKLILAKNSQTISGVFPIKNVEFTGSGTTKVITQTKFENILIGTGVNFTNHAPWEHYNGNLEVTGNLVNNGNIYTSSNGYGDTNNLKIYGSLTNNGNFSPTSLNLGGDLNNEGTWNVVNTTIFLKNPKRFFSRIPLLGNFTFIEGIITGSFSVGGTISFVGETIVDAVVSAGNIVGYNFVVGGGSVNNAPIGKPRVMKKVYWLGFNDAIEYELRKADKNKNITKEYLKILDTFYYLDFIPDEIAYYQFRAKLSDGTYTERSDFECGNMCSLFKKKKDFGPGLLEQLKEAALGAIVDPFYVAKDLADPVNIETGEFIYENTLLKIPGKAGVQFDIIYGNQSEFTTTLGNNFDFNYNKSLEKDELENVVYYNGRLQSFQFNATSEGYEYHDRLQGYLESHTGGYTLTLNNEKILGFDLEGKLLSEKDNLGNGVNLTYNESGYLDTIESTQGDIITFEYYDTNRIGMMTYKDKNIIFEHYTEGDVDGSQFDLKKIITDFNAQNREIRFTYTKSQDPKENDNIKQLFDAKGQIYVENIYQNDRVLEQKYGTQSVKYVYEVDENNKIIANTVTDKNGHITKYEFNQFSLPSKRTHFDDGQIVGSYEYNYNTGGYITEEIHPKGNTYFYEYDERNNLISSRASKNRTQNEDDLITQYEYEPFYNKVSKVIAPNGAVTSYMYDDFGNISEIIQSYIVLGNGELIEKKETFSYDAKGNLLIYIDAEGKEKYFAYNNQNLLVALQSGTGANALRQEFVYDKNGNISKQIDEAGNITHLTYDEYHLLQKVVTPEGFTQEFEYDALNNKTKESIITDDNKKISTSFEYDILDNLVGSVKNIGEGKTQKTILSYDDNGNITSAKDENNIEEKYVYNYNDQIIKKQVGNQVFEYLYDANNNLVESSNNFGEKTLYDYDEYERLKKETTHHGVVTQYFYDANNRIIKTLESTQGNKNIETQYTYNQVGNVLAEKKIFFTNNEVSSNLEQKFVYNKVGQVTRITKANGTTQTLSYDEFGRLKTSTDEYGNITTLSYDVRSLVTQKSQQVAGNILTTQYQYNKDRKLTQEIKPDGGVIQYAYDKLGQVKEMINEKNIKTRYLYDDAGNIIEVIQSYHGQEMNTKFEYNSKNQLTKLTDANGNITQYEYNSFGQITKQTNASGESQVYTYDSFQRLLTSTDYNGTATTYVYDTTNRLKEKNISLAAGVKGITFEKYQYDALGRVIQITDSAGGVLEWSYDAKNLIVSETQNGKKVMYGYNDLGLMTKLITPENQIIHYSYTPEDRLHTVTYNNATIATYSYQNGVLQSTMLGNQKEVSYAYDTYLRLLSLNNGVKTYNYTYDAKGNITSDSVKNYMYDELDRLIEVKLNTNSQKVEGYSYDKMGNRTTSQVANANIEYQSNTLNQYESYTKLGESTQLKYDKNGNIIENKDYFFTYDYKNRLLEVKHKGKWQTVPVGGGVMSVPSEPMLESSSTPVELYSSLEENVSFGMNLGNTTISDGNNTFNFGNIIPPGNSGESQGDYSNFLPGNEFEVTQPASGFPIFEEKNPSLPPISPECPEVYEPVCGVDNVTYPSSCHAGKAGVAVAYAGVCESSELVRGPEFILTQFSYDTLGRRISKTTYDYLDNSHTLIDSLTYVYAGEELLSQTKNGVTSLFISSFQDTDDILAKVENGNILYFHKDHLGSIVAITNNSGTIVAEYSYDAFGKVRNISGDADFENTLLYTGREYDKEIGLFFYRARYYDPELGRFISQDPIGIEDDINLYAYVGNNPVNFTDPSGEKAKDIYRIVNGFDALDMVLDLLELIELDDKRFNSGAKIFRDGMTIVAATGPICKGSAQLTGGCFYGTAQTSLGTMSFVCIPPATLAVSSCTATLAGATMAGHGLYMMGSSFIYEPNPKHGKTKKGKISPEPTNAIEVLNNSFKLPGNTNRRIGVDKKTGEFVVFDETHNSKGKFHGHSRTWNELDQVMKNVLIKEGKVNNRGKIY